MSANSSDDYYIVCVLGTNGMLVSSPPTKVNTHTYTKYTFYIHAHICTFIPNNIHTHTCEKSVQRDRLIKRRWRRGIVEIASLLDHLGACHIICTFFGLLFSRVPRAKWSPPRSHRIPLTLLLL